jgi:hypothetical protein
MIVAGTVQLLSITIGFKCVGIGHVSVYRQLNTMDTVSVCEFGLPGIAAKFYTAKFVQLFILILKKSEI